MLLSRLPKVRARGPGQWSAQCPAHDDKGPSLSIKEMPDGRVLVHCFAGCNVDDVTAAVGLALSDLFPPRESSGAPLRRNRLLPPGQAIELIHDEGQLIAVAGANIANKVRLTDADLARVLQAAGRIAALLDGVRA